MLNFGGLTFYEKDPEIYLTIPNEVVALRIARTVLRTHRKHESIENAPDFLERYGNIRPALSSYQEVMEEWDVRPED